MRANLYIVKTDPDNPRHHGLHANTSPHLLTVAPQPGDEIVYVLGGVVTRDDEGEYAQIRNLSRVVGEPDPEPVIVESHLGRAVMLGEDGAEDAFGRDVLAELWLETLDEPTGWEYAPVSARHVAGEAGDSLFRLLTAAKRDGKWTLLTEK